MVVLLCVLNLTFFRGSLGIPVLFPTEHQSASGLCGNHLLVALVDVGDCILHLSNDTGC